MKSFIAMASLLISLVAFADDVKVKDDLMKQISFDSKLSSKLVSADGEMLLVLGSQFPEEVKKLKKIVRIQVTTNETPNEGANDTLTIRIFSGELNVPEWQQEETANFDILTVERDRICTGRSMGTRCSFKYKNKGISSRKLDRTFWLTDKIVE